MRDDEIALVVCSPEDAEYLMSKEPKLADCLVINPLMPIGELIMVPAEEFMDYLYEDGHLGEKIIKEEE